MTERTWNIKGNTDEHVICVQRDWSGRVLISVDGEEVLQKSSKLADFGSRHEFTIDGVECLIEISHRALASDYRLTTILARNNTNCDINDWHHGIAIPGPIKEEILHIRSLGERYKKIIMSYPLTKKEIKKFTLDKSIQWTIIASLVSFCIGICICIRHDSDEFPILIFPLSVVAFSVAAFLFVWFRLRSMHKESTCIPPASLRDGELNRRFRSDEHVLAEWANSLASEISYGCLTDQRVFCRPRERFSVDSTKEPLQEYEYKDIVGCETIHHHHQGGIWNIDEWNEWDINEFYVNLAAVTGSRINILPFIIIGLPNYERRALISLLREGRLKEGGDFLLGESTYAYSYRRGLDGNSHVAKLTWAESLLTYYEKGPDGSLIETKSAFLKEDSWARIISEADKKAEATDCHDRPMDDRAYQGSRALTLREHLGEEFKKLERAARQGDTGCLCLGITGITLLGLLMLIILAVE